MRLSRPRVGDSFLRLTAGLILAALPLSLRAANLPDGFTEVLVAENLGAPTAMAFAPDGRLFVCSQDGDLRVIKDGVLLPTPFVNLNVDSHGERGLLGVAFDPDFATNQFVYVYYTVPGTRPTTGSAGSPPNGDVAVAGSEQIILSLEPLSAASNHNGGAHPLRSRRQAVRGGRRKRERPERAELGQPARQDAAHQPRRDDPDATTRSSRPPTGQTARSGPWACATRSPSRSSPAPAACSSTTSARARCEEINDGVAGANYGWPESEGPRVEPRPRRAPLFAYGHGAGGTRGCAITGGAFYNPAVQQFPADYVGDVLLRRPLQRVDPPVRPGDRGPPRPSPPASRTPSTSRSGRTASSITSPAARRRCGRSSSETARRTRRPRPRSRTPPAAPSTTRATRSNMRARPPIPKTAPPCRRAL